MRLAIRDDDTSYFTRPEQLDRIYARLRGVPVSLAVTPFALACENLGNPDQFRQWGEPHPLEANAELMAYLRPQMASGRYSLLGHGYTHQYRHLHGQWIPECIWKPAGQLREETACGRVYLESTLGVAVDAYVPPSNTISLRGLEAVAETLPNVLATLPLRRAAEWLLSGRQWTAWGRRLADQLRLGGPSPFVYQLGRVRLLACTSWTKAAQQDAVIRRMELCRRLGADFTLAVHYWELDAELTDGLQRLVDRALAMGFEPAHCRELFGPAGGQGQMSRSETEKEGPWAAYRTS